MPCCICFNSLEVQLVLRFLDRIKYFGPWQNKKFPKDRYVKQKGTFRKIFRKDFVVYDLHASF